MRRSVTVIRDVPAGVIECDEVWTLVRKKDRHIIKTKHPDPWKIGSQFITLAMDCDTKLVLAHQVGKRVDGWCHWRA